MHEGRKYISTTYRKITFSLKDNANNRIEDLRNKITNYQMIKRQPTFKQMAFETAIRNPERYKKILSAVYPFVNQKLDDSVLLKIVSSLYLNEIVTSEEVPIREDSTIDSISAAVIEVNSTRRADGGFPMGYQSRFWTYMRTLSEMGFVYAQYNEKFLFSDISIKLINNELDEQEAFSLQAMKYNRKSPYRNVSNDFNYFRFILEVLNIKERLTYEQFIVSTFSNNGNVNEFLTIIENNKFADLQDVETFLRREYGTTLKSQTILRDYPDVVLRLLNITGFISVQFAGKVFICRNLKNDEYINDLLKIKIDLTDNEKSNTLQHFQRLETYNTDLLQIVIKHKEDLTGLDGFDYTQKIAKIIENYKLTEEIITEGIRNLDKTNTIPEFKYISEPLKLEFYISLIVALKYGNQFAIKPNYKTDYIGLPISTASGNMGDIEVYSRTIYWLIEVTLIRNKTQQLNSETTSVLRHLLEDNKINSYLSKYLSLVAPAIHEDTKNFLDYSVVLHKSKDQNLYIKAYDFENFIDIGKKQFYRYGKIY